jgi:hypothetical protein
VGTNLRTFAIAGATSVGLVLYLVLWFRWPITLSLALGALMATLIVMTTASIAEDPAKADAAWREAAPDLVDLPLDVVPPSGTSVASQPGALGDPEVGAQASPADADHRAVGADHAARSGGLHE